MAYYCFLAFHIILAKTTSQNHLQRLRNNLDLYSAKHKNIILIGDFNISPEDSHMKTFCESYGVKNLI